jgi:hypothetical protein
VSPSHNRVLRPETSIPDECGKVSDGKTPRGRGCSARGNGALTFPPKTLVNFQKLNAYRRDLWACTARTEAECQENEGLA